MTNEANSCILFLVFRNWTTAIAPTETMGTVAARPREAALTEEQM
jgi:hypothetical protein